MRGLVAAIAVWAVGVGVWPVHAADSPIHVVASIKPLQSLIAGVMQDVAVPDVLIKGGGSLHAYALRPSDAELLNAADVIFWVGPSFETFLAKPLATVGGQAQTIALLGRPEIKVLPAREGGLWESADDIDHANGRVDGHIWLAPANAKAIVTVIAQTLSERDPRNAPRYRDNAKTLNAKLDALDDQLGVTLAPMKDRPFIVFHDAYQYFETSYGLKAAGSITVSPERMPGARRVVEIKQKISALGPTCVFSEPQFEPKLVQTLIGGTRAKTAVLDPEGSTLAPGPELLFNLMRNLADNLVTCLTAP